MTNGIKRHDFVVKMGGPTERAVRAEMLAEQLRGRLDAEALQQACAVYDMLPIDMSDEHTIIVTIATYLDNLKPPEVTG